MLLCFVIAGSGLVMSASTALAEEQNGSMKALQWSFAGTKVRMLDQDLKRIKGSIPTAGLDTSVILVDLSDEQTDVPRGHIRLFMGDGSVRYVRRGAIDSAKRCELDAASGPQNSDTKMAVSQGLSAQELLCGKDR